MSTAAWQDVLAQTRAWNAQPVGCDLRPWLRVRAWRAAAGQPEPLLRAQAFAAVLAGIGCHVHPGELVVGSRRGFCAERLPDGADPAAVAAAHAERGQRDFWAGWDHTLADYPRLLAVGIDGLIAQAEASRRGRSDAGELAFLDAALVCLRGLAAFARRHAAACRELGMVEQAAVLDGIAGPPPATFAGAVQLVWLVHLAFSAEGRYAMALGRLDQYLLPFYRRDCAAGRLDRDGALDLLLHLWAHIEELGEVTNICIGGLTPDGADATNALSYLCLEATRLVQSPHTNLSARFHDGTPAAFHRACFDCIRTGVGFPAIFNDHVLLPGLAEIGIPAEVARDYCMVGCIETMLAGRQPAWSDSRFNTPLHLLRVLRRRPSTWEELHDAFDRELQAALAAHAAAVDAHLAARPAARLPDPFLSALTDDCLGRARDVNDGGARFPRFHGIAIMGLATVADALAALRELVYTRRTVGLDELLAALDADFAGHEPLRQRLLNHAPKYGNGEAAVDRLAAWLVERTADLCLGLRLHDGGRFVAAVAANVQNISAGREVGATPDGRHAGTPLSDAASPYFGRDRRGPTAFLQSVATPDYHRALTGSVINMKFEPAHFAGDAGAERFAAFTRAFVRLRIPELQFNFTGDALLRAAREHPEEHAGLVVRVSGFSAYFTRLDPAVQEDIIRRRAHA